MTGYLIQCHGSDTYNVAVIPTFNRDLIIELCFHYIDMKWAVEREDVQLTPRDDTFDVINVAIEEHIDEDCFTVSEVELVGLVEEV